MCKKLNNITDGISHCSTKKSCQVQSTCDTASFGSTQQIPGEIRQYMQKQHEENSTPWLRQQRTEGKGSGILSVHIMWKKCKKTDSEIRQNWVHVPGYSDVDCLGNWGPQNCIFQDCTGC